MVDQVEKVAGALEEAWLARGYGEGDKWNYLARAAITAYNPNERRAEVEPTQRGDDTAAAMRAYYEAHKRDKWTPGTADNLMLGLLNIVLGEYGANPNERLREALEFYADPENYHAISFMFDRPCGLFEDDFDEDHGHEDYDRPMPGKRAREALSPTSPSGLRE